MAVIGKLLKIVATIIWLIVYVPVAFLIHLTIPHVNKLVKWVQAKEITLKQRLARFVLALPVMIIFLPLVFLVSIGSAVLEDNFTKHL